MKLLSFFRLSKDGVMRGGSTKVDEIEDILRANGGVREKAIDGGEYQYIWKCKEHVVFVNYRLGARGIQYAWVN